MEYISEGKYDASGERGIPTGKKPVEILATLIKHNGHNPIAYWKISHENRDLAEVSFQIARLFNHGGDSALCFFYDNEIIKKYDLPAENLLHITACLPTADFFFHSNLF